MISQWVPCRCAAYLSFALILTLILRLAARWLEMTSGQVRNNIKGRGQSLP